ncbi:MAG: ABC transporter ATP-binding protein [Syntrophorhabdales bacterium]|jgi:branched-chain amino acid transport system ATP-binding protein
MLFEVKNLKVSYKGAEVLRGISLEIEKGEIVTLIGSNGAGKTTALRAISGLKTPDAGEIRFKEKRIDGLSPAEVVKMGISHVPQGRWPFPYMSVLENMKLGAYRRRDKKQVERDIRDLFEQFPVLGKRQGQQARTLSGGEQQMLVIARGLMSSPELLLMDEPSLGLAPALVREIRNIVLDINRRGTSILLVEQNAQLALKVAHRGYVLETGSVVLQGAASELLQSGQVKRAYLSK